MLSTSQYYASLMEEMWWHNQYFLIVICYQCNVCLIIGSLNNNCQLIIIKIKLNYNLHYLWGEALLKIFLIFFISETLITSFIKSIIFKVHLLILLQYRLYHGNLLELKCVILLCVLKKFGPFFNYSFYC